MDCIEGKIRLSCERSISDKRLKTKNFEILLLYLLYRDSGMNILVLKKLLLVAMRELQVSLVKSLFAANYDVISNDYDMVSQYSRVMHTVCKMKNCLQVVGTLVFEELGKKISTYNNETKNVIQAAFKLWCVSYDRLIESILAQRDPVFLTLSTKQAALVYDFKLFLESVSVNCQRVNFSEGASSIFERMSYEKGDCFKSIHDFQPRDESKITTTNHSHDHEEITLDRSRCCNAHNSIENIEVVPENCGLEVSSFVEEQSNAHVDKIFKYYVIEYNTTSSDSLLNYFDGYCNYPIVQNLSKVLCNGDSQDFTESTTLKALQTLNNIRVKFFQELCKELFVGCGRALTSPDSLTYENNNNSATISKFMLVLKSAINFIDSSNKQTDLCTNFAVEHSFYLNCLKEFSHCDSITYGKINSSEEVSPLFEEINNKTVDKILNSTKSLQLLDASDILLDKIYYGSVQDLDENTPFQKIVEKPYDEHCNINFIENVLSLIKDRRNNEVKLILEKHVFQSVDNLGNTLLHHSVECGNRDVTQYLLEINYQVDALNLESITPLMVAVRKMDTAIIKILLGFKADIMIRNKKEMNALHIVLQQEYFVLRNGELIYDELCKKLDVAEERAQCLMDHGCTMQHVCGFNDVNVAKYFLDSGYSVDFYVSEFGLPGVHLAAAYDAVDILKFFVERNVQIDVLDYRGSNLLNWVYRCDKKHTRKKFELLKFVWNLEGISRTSCNGDGLFCMSPILLNGNYKAIRLVLESNIDFTVEDEYSGSNILHYLALNKNPGIIAELKLHMDKFDLTRLNRHYVSPLHHSTKHNNFEMTKFLLDYGVMPIFATLIKGNTPLYLAYANFKPRFKKEWNECIELLLQKDADPQCIITEENNEQITIFDTMKKPSFYRLKPVIAQLAVIKQLGVPIKEIISIKINSQPSLQKYFNKCQKVLGLKIYGFLTLFELLTCNDEKITRYFRNEELILKLQRLGIKRNIKQAYSLYYSTLKRRSTAAIRRSRFLDKIAAAICKIFESGLNAKLVDGKNPVIDKIVNYLDYESREQLWKMIFNYM